MQSGNSNFFNKTKTKKPVDQIIDITGYPLSPVEKDETGKYVFPTSPCGVLPFYINKDKELVWGCMETNRCLILSTQPAAGTQNMIARKDGERISIEVAKRLPELTVECLAPYARESVDGDNYQKIISVLHKNGYEVYLESLLGTAVKETQEENGVDLQKNGRNQNLVIKMYDFANQVVLAKRGESIQKIYVAHLTSDEGIVQSFEPAKVEEKISFTKGRIFYEKGIWCTLKQLKTFYAEQQIKYNESSKEEFTSGENKLIGQEFRAWKSRIELIGKVETSLLAELHFFDDGINSIAEESYIPYRVMKESEWKNSEEASLTPGFKT